MPPEVPGFLGAPCFPVKRVSSGAKPGSFCSANIFARAWGKYKFRIAVGQGAHASPCRCEATLYLLLKTRQELVEIFYLEAIVAAHQRSHL